MAWERRPELLKPVHCLGGAAEVKRGPHVVAGPLRDKQEWENVHRRKLAPSRLRAQVPRGRDEERVGVMLAMDILEGDDAARRQVVEDGLQRHEHLVRLVAAVVDQGVDRCLGGRNEEILPHVRISLVADADRGHRICELVHRRVDVDAVNVALRSEHRFPHRDGAAGLDADLRELHRLPGQRRQEAVIGRERIRPLPDPRSLGVPVVEGLEAQRLRCHGDGTVGAHELHRKRGRGDLRRGKRFRRRHRTLRHKELREARWERRVLDWRLLHATAKLRGLCCRREEACRG
mmetsp:Transcript_62096/g.173413  ORF Transcript_62096/g.173413 Transcript_62096/m.173413 type:complete len:290 (-) Transcript_62096:91-960(-)